MNEMVQDKLTEITALFMALGKSMGELLEVLISKEKDEPKALKAEVKEEKAEEPKAEEPKPETKKYSMEEVRKALSAKSGEGYTEEIKALLAKHGAERLSAIPETEYAAIMEEVQKIGSTQ